MRDVTVERVKNLKTKDVFNVFYKNTNTKVIAKEKFKNGTIKWYPFYINRDSKVVPKYTNIKYIATKNNKFPKVGFSVADATGYGFTSAQGVNNFFKFIDKNPEINAIIFTESLTVVTGSVLELNFLDFAKLRNQAKLFSNSKNDEEEHLIKSVFHSMLPDNYKEPSKLLYFPGKLDQFLGKYNRDNITLSADEAIELRNILLGSDLPTELIVSTRREIQKVYIEDVIEQYKELMKYKLVSKNLEARWHEFFKKHTWIFSQIFAFPAVYFKDKVNVGGHDFTGSTDKIVDFLYKNEFTNNLAFIEIKTHKTNLVSATPYRKPDVYSVSKDVTGATVQVLDQRNRLLKNFQAKKGSANIESLNSHCIIIAGDLNMLKSKAKRDSFELFRSGSRDVIIVTFDELLRKMTTLLEIFTKS